MALRVLDNASWGFDTSCFVCEPSNPRGLGIRYSHDEEGEVVVAEFSLGREFSGVPSYVHGGVVLAILDEAMAWAAIAIAGRWAVVQHTATTFDRPVRLDTRHRVEASVSEPGDDSVTARASVVDEAGRVCARAHARLAVMTVGRARSAVGRVGDEHTRYLRKGTS
ncbi:MAG: PaaI family thioesterase [Actinomycetota bacterium]|nr:PaaI family thioesterase [Actinomycetota bacterium]